MKSPETNTTPDKRRILSNKQSKFAATIAGLALLAGGYSGYKHETSHNRHSARTPVTQSAELNTRETTMQRILNDEHLQADERLQEDAAFLTGLKADEIDHYSDDYASLVGIAQKAQHATFELSDALKTSDRTVLYSLLSPESVQAFNHHKIEFAIAAIDPTDSDWSPIDDIQTNSTIIPLRTS